MLSPTHVPPLFKYESHIQDSLNHEESNSWTKVIRQLASQSAELETNGPTRKIDDIAKRLSASDLLPTLCEEWKKLEHILPREILQYILTNHTTEQILNKIHLATLHFGKPSSSTPTNRSAAGPSPNQSPPTRLPAFTSKQTNFLEWTNTLITVIKRNIVVKENHTLWYHGSPCNIYEWDNGIDIRQSRYNGEFSVNQSFYLTQSVQFAVSHAFIGKVTKAVSGSIVIAQIPNEDSNIWNFDKVDEYERHEEWQKCVYHNMNRQHRNNYPLPQRTNEVAIQGPICIDDNPTNTGSYAHVRAEQEYSHIHKTPAIRWNDKPQQLCLEGPDGLALIVDLSVLAFTYVSKETAASY